MHSFVRLLVRRLRPVDRLATRLDPLPAYPAILPPTPVDFPLDATPAYFAPTPSSSVAPLAPIPAPSLALTPSARFARLSPRSLRPLFRAHPAH